MTEKNRKYYTNGNELNTHWKTNTVNMSCDSIKSLLDVECAVTFTYFVYIKKSVCLISADKTICLTRLRS